MSEKLTMLGHLKQVAEKAKDFTAELITQVASTAASAIAEVHALKADKFEAISFSIPSSGWVAEEMGQNKYYIDIKVDGITAKDLVTVNISPVGQVTAIACGLCPTNETLQGVVRLWAEAIPTSEISAEYWVMSGKAEEETEE